jgi:xanthine/uracil permease
MKTMAKRPIKPERPRERPIQQEEGELRLGKRNFLMLSLGVLLICLGYVRLRQGSITDAPILLVLGYCVVIPLGLVLKP